MRRLTTVVIVTILMMSCGSDDETPTTPQVDIVGTYMIDSARDECPDAADNVSVDNIGMGICIGQTCTTITLIFNSDDSYTYEQLDIFDDGAIRNTSRVDEVGTYVISGNVVTTTSTDNIITDYDIVDLGRFIDWTAATTSGGCDRIFRFGR